MEKKWIFKKQIEQEQVDQFRSELKVSPIIAQLLLQRDIDTYDKANTFFNPSLSDLHDPYLMKGMHQAVALLNKTLESNEKILLYGDYDVDGTTAVALMYSYLRSLNAQLEYYIPDRYEEGYGLSKKGVDYAIVNKFTLVILLDCGIKSAELIQYGMDQGLQFIVCDHHEPGAVIPPSIVLNPKQKDCNYPFKELCGCGVGFKLLQGLIQSNRWNLDSLYIHLDLLAVAIGADIVPVTGENRILAHHGIRILNEQKRTSLDCLLQEAKRNYPVSLTDVVFTIAPRINSAGRIMTGKHAVDLLISENLVEIREIAKRIENFNNERKELDSSITTHALEILEQDEWYKNSKSTVVYSDDWSKGVVGIVASRLIENSFKPTIVLTETDGKLTGSARTVNTFDIYTALTKCEHLLEQFGGHAYAAGLTLRKENFIEFRSTFEKVIAETLSIEEQFPIEYVDLELDFDQIFEKEENRTKVPKLKRILNRMEPFGPGNMNPVFYTKNVFSEQVKILKDKHLKLVVIQPGSDVKIDAIGFNLAHKHLEVASGVAFEMIYSIETNVWNNKTTLQLNIKDLREM
ncbi:MAG TPA: single-stranded-DNA-specific exonuclease RecJ [Taishania sp.]|nr:single-stranded-DNA-specific exonuclease RecJ [Taishania sp.]